MSAKSLVTVVAERNGWNADLSDPVALSGVDPACKSSAFVSTLAVHTYLKRLRGPVGNIFFTNRDRSVLSTRSTDVYDKDRKLL